MLISGRTGTGVESGVIGVEKLLLDYGHYEPTGPKVCASRALGHAPEGPTSSFVHRTTKRVSLVSPAEQKQRNANLSHLRRCSVFRRIEAIPGVQTEALWTHLDPFKPPEKAPCPPHQQISRKSARRAGTSPTARIGMSNRRCELLLLRWFYCTYASRTPRPN